MVTSKNKVKNVNRFGTDRIRVERLAIRTSKSGIVGMNKDLSFFEFDNAISLVAGRSCEGGLSPSETLKGSV